MIRTMFFALFLFFKSIIIPRPELTNKPDKSAPKDKVSLTNNSVINNDDEQLGIKPINAATIG